MNQSLYKLVETIQKLALAGDLENIMGVTCSAARDLISSDGATFVLREEDQCFYADEDAIRPLWKGQRFPMSACISGWVMLNQQTAVIKDVYIDARIPASAYRPTFVKSLVMVPLRRSSPLGAIGNYWEQPHSPTSDEVQLLQILGDAAAIAAESVSLSNGPEPPIVELRRADELLREQEYLLTESQRVAGIGSWFWDMKGPMKWTAEMFRICGVSAETFIPTVESVVDLGHPEDRPAMKRWIEACVAGENSRDLEFRVILPHGSVRVLSGRGELIYDTQKKFAFIAGTVQDITKRKRAENALRVLSQRLIEAEDAIRRSINHQLHDRIGANLSALSVSHSILMSKLTPRSRRAVSTRLDDTQRLLDETITHIRDVMAELHPPALDDYGLPAALRSGPNPLDSLSQREREILQLVAAGCTSIEIAGKLNLSPKTVDSYRSRLMKKLEIHDVPGLVKFSILHGLTTLV